MMEKIFTAVITVLLVWIFVYLLLLLSDKLFELNIEKKGNFIKDYLVNIVLVISGLSSGVISYLRFANMKLPLIILSMILFVFMPVLTVTDCKKQLVPNKIILGAIILWVITISLSVIIDINASFNLVISAILGAVISGVIFLLSYFLSKKQLGAGYVKLAFVMGLYLTGSRVIGALLYGSVFCCIYSLVQLARKKLTLKSGVPMVPFLYLAMIVTFLTV